jgi:hypothetical protein
VRIILRQRLSTPCHKRATRREPQQSVTATHGHWVASACGYDCPGQPARALPNFQAGHEGSIPFARSSISEDFFEDSRDFLTPCVPAACRKRAIPGPDPPFANTAGAPIAVDKYVARDTVVCHTFIHARDR